MLLGIVNRFLQLLHQVLHHLAGLVCGVLRIHYRLLVRLLGVIGGCVSRLRICLHLI